MALQDVANMRLYEPVNIRDAFDCPNTQIGARRHGGGNTRLALIPSL